MGGPDKISRENFDFIFFDFQLIKFIENSIKLNFRKEIFYSQKMENPKEKSQNFTFCILVGIFVIFNTFTVHQEWMQLIGNLWQKNEFTKSDNSRASFNAIVDMENLIAFEQSFTTKILEQYLSQEQAKIDALKKIIAEYSSTISKYSNSSASSGMNPLTAYLFIKQFIRNWQGVQQALLAYEGQTTNGLAKQIVDSVPNARHANLQLLFQAPLVCHDGPCPNGQRQKQQFPGLQDQLAAGVALLDYQEIYELPTSNLADGRVDGDGAGMEDGKVMSAEDCYEIGMIAFKMEKHFYASEWLQEALKRLNSSDTQFKQQILEPLAHSQQQLGQFKHANSSNSEWENYKRLCRGEISEKVLNASNKLYCYLKRDRPFLKLAPLKVELVHQNPLIALFRGVISDQEIEVVQRLAKPKLVRATAFQNAKGEIGHVPFRISKTAWVNAREHPAIERLNRRIQDMTNLDLETAFDLKVFKYGTGGHYTPHWDFVKLPNGQDPFDPDGTKGNRVATCLFYLSQPTSGGRTIFTELGIGIAPSLNDALFWYNLHRDGQGDLRTKHAACPVLTGDKWIFTKLINERGQEWIRPCPVNKDEQETFVGDV